MGRLVVNSAVTVNGAFEAPAREPDEWLVLDADSNQVSLEQFLVADARDRGPRARGRDAPDIDLDDQFIRSREGSASPVLFVSIAPRSGL